MASKPQRNKLFVVILVILLVFSACQFLTPSAFALQPTIQQKGVGILNGVIGLDLTKYNVATTIYSNDSSGSYFGVASLQKIQYNLTSGQNTLNVLCMFANDNLQSLHVLDSKGSPVFASPKIVDAVGSAKNFLANYQTYTAESIYGQLESTLNNVDASKNLTRASGNTEFNLTTLSDGYTAFKWTYKIDGIMAPSKFVALGFSNNSLSYFVDNWQLYKIGSTTVTLSENQAETMALKIAESHSWSIPLDNDTFNENNFNQSNVAFATLLFDFSTYKDLAHSGDPLTLYPVWRVGVQLNKWYGDLYGIEVDVFADTGQVISAQEALSTLHPQFGMDVTTNSSIAYRAALIDNAQIFNPTLIMWLVLFNSVIIGPILVWMVNKKTTVYERRIKVVKFKTIYPFSLLLKHSKSINVTALICIMLLSSLTFFISTPTVEASPTTSTAIIWGSESSGQLYGQQQPYNYWRKTYSETLAQEAVAADVSSSFYYAGWAGPNGISSNQQGYPGSWRFNILNELDNMKNSNSVNVAIVDFDHGVGTSNYIEDIGIFHYMSEDAGGNYIGDYPGDWDPYNAVYDNDIYHRVNSGEVTFAFISTCMSADYYNSLGALNYDYYYQQYGITQGPLPDGTYRGMPYAYTHRLVGSQMSSNGYSSPDAGSQVYIGFPKGSPSLTQTLPNLPNNPGSYTYGAWVELFFSDLCSQMTVHNALDTASQTLWGTNFLLSPLSQYSAGGGFEPSWYVQGQNSYWPISWMNIYGNGNIQLPLEPPLNTINILPSWGGYTNPLPGLYADTGNIPLTAYANDGFEFQYWLMNGQYLSSESTIYVDYAGYSFQPVFLELYDTVIITACDAYLGEYYPLEPNVYINGNWVGTAPITLQVSPRTELTISVDNTVYDPWWPAWDVPLERIDVNNNPYYDGNTVYITAYPSTTVNALYTQWW